jgi:glucose-6-phosphate dehydrogenase assembly protein OpcA
VSTALESFTAGVETAVDVARVERQLRELWKLAGPNVTRASLFNLVAWCETAESRDRAAEIIGDITGRVPCRAIVVLAESNAADELSATVTARCQLPAGGRKQVCCEQISITAGGSRVGRVESAVLPLLEGDLPTVLWWRGNFTEQPALFQRWEDVASRVIFDSSTDPCASNPPANGTDLNWTRLALWRELWADCFDDPAVRAALPAMKRLTVEYGCGPGAHWRALLFAGWVTAQTPVPVELSCREDAEATGLLSVELSGPVATVRLWKNFGEQTVSATVMLPTVCRLPLKRAFAPLDEAALLARELEQPSPAHAYRQALAGVAALR